MSTFHDDPFLTYVVDAEHAARRRRAADERGLRSRRRAPIHLRRHVGDTG